MSSYTFSNTEAISMSDHLNIIEGLLRQQTPVSFRAGGPSMNPTIRDGELVRIRPLRPGDLRPGLIALYRKNGRLVLHRVIRRNATSEKFYLVADAALSGGEWVKENQMAGIAESVRHGKSLRRLDRAGSRMTGLVRYALRPLRRMLTPVFPAAHADTSEHRS